MKKWMLILVTVLVGCSVSYEGTASFSWDPRTGNLWVNETIINDSTYELDVPEGMDIQVRFEPNEAEGWSFSQWHFRVISFFTGDMGSSEVENPLTYPADFDHMNLEVEVNRFWVRDFSLIEDRFYCCLSDENENHYLLFDPLDQSFSALSLTDSQSLSIENQILYVSDWSGDLLKLFTYSAESDSLEFLYESSKELFSSRFGTISSSLPQYAYCKHPDDAPFVLYLFNYSTNSLKSLAIGKGDYVENLFWNAAGTELFYLVQNDTTLKKTIYRVLESSTGLSVQKVVELPGYSRNSEALFVDENNYAYYIYTSGNVYSGGPESGSVIIVINLDDGTATETFHSEYIYGLLDDFFSFNGKVYINTDRELILLDKTQQSSVFNYTNQGFLEGDIARPLSTAGEFLVKSKLEGAYDLYLYKQATSTRTRITTPERILPLLETEFP